RPHDRRAAREIGADRPSTGRGGRVVHRLLSIPCGTVFDVGSFSMVVFSHTLTDAVSRLHGVPRDPALLHPLPETDLHALVRQLGDARRELDSLAALVTGEITRRSAPELGI